MKNNAGGTQSKKGAIFYDTTFAGFQLHIAHKGPGIAIVVAERVAQLATLVA
jgi:hypothetical protein